MALTLPPQRNKKKEPTEAQIEAIINKGGTPTSAETNDPNTLRHVSARVTDEVIRQIDALRAQRPRKMGSPKMGVSLRDWIVEAILEKLERDSKKKR